MSCIIIDFKNIINKKKHNFLLEKIDPSPITKFQLGLLLIIDKKQKIILDNLNLGQEKISYLNTNFFIKNIQEYTYLIINKDLCEIVSPIYNYISLIIETIEKNFEKVTKILVSIPIKNTKTIQEYSKKYFGKPHICNKSNKENTICLLRDKYNTKNYLNDINYVIKQYKKTNYCTISAKLTTDCISYMKSLCENGFTTNKNGKITQKEIAGNMYAKIDDNLIYNIEINNNSIIHGNEFGVDIVEGLYNFHSHPRNAYTFYNVKLGWPSAQDYIGFLLASIEDDTVFHLVITLEGIYVISLSLEWLKTKDKLNDKKTNEFIYKNYDFCYKEGDTVKWYLSKVNNIKYKKKYLFNIQYLKWKHTHKIFTIYYGKKEENCFSCNETKELYDKLYNK